MRLIITSQKWKKYQNVGSIHRNQTIWQCGFVALMIVLSICTANARTMVSTINCPPPVTISCDQPIDASNTGIATGTTTCASSSQVTIISLDDASNLNGCANTGFVVRTWTATDQCNESTSCQQVISVEDVTSPTIMCPSTMLIACEQDTSPSNLGFPIVSDNCAISSEITVSHSDQVENLTGCNNTGTFTRMWFATDPCGNNAICTQTIVITDDTDPIITCPESITVNCDGNIDPSTVGTATALDGCTPSEDLLINYSDNLLGLTGCQGTGSIVRTWQVNDACGNIAVCTQIITIADNDSPTIVCPENATISCDADNSPANIGAATGEDACGIAIISFNDDISLLSGCNGTGIITRTWNATDGCGNSATCNQIINVQDNENPELTCPENITIDCGQSTDPSVTGTLDASDNCSTGSLLSVDYTDVPEVLSGCNNTGVIQRNWTATDDCGNLKSCLQIITVNDDISPDVNCPEDIVITCDASMEPENTGFPTADDNCTDVLDLIIDFSDDQTNSNGCNGTGMIVRTWSVVDACGNSNLCEQAVMIIDDIQPTLTCAPELTISCEDNTAPGATGFASAIDNCTPAEDLIIEFSDIENFNGCNQTGTLIRTWSAADACGNSVSCTQIIHIVDETAPVISCPENLVLSCNDPLSPDATGYPTGSDNCTPAEDLEMLYADDLSGLTNCMATGTLLRNWTVIDDCSNVTTCQQTIVVQDIEAPVLTCPTNVEISCEDDMSTNSLGMATAEDNCTADQLIAITFEDNTDVLPACNGTGILVRTFTASDACGNESSCAQTIQVMDEAAPTIQCPASLAYDCGDDVSPDAIGYAIPHDNCSPDANIVLLFEDNTEGLNGCNGTGNMTRTWKAIDLCGNENTCVQTLTIVDEAAPVLSCPAATTLSCESSIDTSVAGNIAVFDNCTSFDDLEIDFSDTEQGLVGCNGSGSVIRTWTVVDRCGNSSTCSQQISVADVTPPVIACNEPVTIGCGTSQDTSSVSPPDVTDNCSAPSEISVLFFDNATGLTGCNGSGTLVRNWIAFDGCGNMSQCDQIIQVVDNQAPIITVPEDKEVNCELADDMGVLGVATAVDNCSPQSDVHVYFADINDGLNGCNGTGLKVRMWIAADGCGNIDTAYQNITLIDTLAPLFYCPLDIAVDATGNIYDFDEMGEVEVLVDNCAPIDAVNIDYEDDIINLENCDSAPTIRRTWFVSDQCGNVGSCVQRISVDHYIAPQPNFPSDLELDCSDNVDDMSLTGLASISNSAADLLIDTVYYIDMQLAEKDNEFIHMREWIAIDFCQNVTKDTQYIFMIDNDSPEVVVHDMEITFVDSFEHQIHIEDLLVSAFDNCTQEISYSISPAILTCDAFLTSSSQVITITATDDYGNATIVQASAVVVDPQVVFECPSNIIVDLDPGECNAIVNYVVSATVSCGADAAISQTDGTNLTTADMFPIGTTIQTYEATDALNVTSTCTFTIEVNGFDPGEFLVCNDTVHVSVNESCVAQISADEILEGDSYGCYENYELTSSTPGAQFINGELNGIPHVGEYLDVCVEDLTTGNFCCGVIFVEDKLPPVIECQDDTLSCSMDYSPLSIDLFPVPENTIITPLQNGDFVATGIDNCNSVILSYEDEDNVSMCVGDYINIITRTWIATDRFGNSDTCAQKLYLERGSFEDFTFPADTVIECNDACILSDGTTDPACTGGIEGDFCGQFFIAKTDKIIPGCGMTYAILRTWTLVDWCNPDNIIDSVQIIQIDDSRPPVMNCPDTVHVSLDQASCVGTAVLTPPTATDACMSDSITFGLSNGVEIFNEVNGTYTIENLGIGSSIYQWDVRDACNNYATCSFVVTIVDDVVPVAYCDLHTVVAIQNEDDMGVTLSPATVFNDGSFDACSDVTFRVRRMQSCIDFDWNGPNDSHVPDGNINGLDNGLSFRETVPFSCCDVASQEPIMVQLEVTDEAGNVNYCMVEVAVQDKIAPEIVCPPEIFVSCTYWFDEEILDDLNDRTFGTVVDGFFADESDRKPIIINDPANPNYSQPHNWGLDGFATDNCNMDLSLNVRLYDDCSGETLPGNGPDDATRLVERTFVAADPSGKSSACRQRIWVVNFDPFYINSANSNDPTDDVVWPADIEVDHCGIPDTIYPTILNDECGTIAVSLSEQKLQFDEGSCMKILREWSVIDWCQYNSNTGEGLWKYTQIVKITDNAAAIFIDCPEGLQTICSANDNVTDVLPTLTNETPCAAHVVLTHEIEDVCSEEIIYDVKLYPFNGSNAVQALGETSVTLVGGKAIISFDSKVSSASSIRLNGIPYNSISNPNDAHRILFSIVDACGNYSTCSYLFRLEDCKQPSPVCINGISTVVMEESGEVVIWASEFDASSFDNCTADLRFSFSGSSYVPSQAFNCDNIPAFGSQIPVEIWAWDDWNNRDFCTTTIVFTDNGNACGNPIAGLLGEVATDNHEMVENATVTLSNPNNFFSQMTTIEDGVYQFSSVPPALNYEVSVERNDDHKNGVSSLDIIRIQKHLLGVEPFDTPYEFIAADINRSESVSALDIIELRKLILGVYTEFPQNKSWNFVPTTFEFTDPFNPWPFNEILTMDVDSGFVLQEDFTAVKIGDLNHTVTANATQIITRNAPQVITLNVPDQNITAGQEFDLEVSLEDFADLAGLQLTLEGEDVEFKNISSDLIDVSTSNFAIFKNQLTFSWSDAASQLIEPSETLFTVHLVSTRTMHTSDIKLSSAITNAEAYDSESEIFNLELKTKGIVEFENQLDISLYQNAPNPFSDKTVISFDLPISTEVTLSVFDVNGRLVLNRQRGFDAGQSNWTVTSEELGLPGMYYYQIQTKEGQAMTKKMIMIH